MTDSPREMIAEIVHEHADFRSDTDAVTDQFIAALPQIIKGMVKPLDWEKTFNGGPEDAASFGKSFEAFGDDHVRCNDVQFSYGLLRGKEAVEAWRVAQLLTALGMGND